ncbi:MAG: hypothetical protein AB7E72_13110 [Lysobacterales bacterium]
MSLCLCFVPAGVEFEDVDKPDYKASRSVRSARSKILKQLIEAYPGTEAPTNMESGLLTGFPRGEMMLAPGFLSWSLHGVTDEAPIRAIVDWFLRRGWYCVDPQDAGFGNREAMTEALPDTLKDYDELIGAQLSGLRLEREWGSGLALDWLMADGRMAHLRFATFVNGQLPDLAELLDHSVSAVHVDDTQIGRYGHDFTIVLSNGHELKLGGAVYRSCILTRIAGKPIR